MLLRIILFIGGIFLSAYGLLFMIIYLNLINIGLTFDEYFKLICARYECMSFFIGLLMIGSAFIRKKVKNDLYI